MKGKLPGQIRDLLLQWLVCRPCGDGILDLVSKAIVCILFMSVYGLPPGNKISSYIPKAF